MIRALAFILLTLAIGPVTAAPRGNWCSGSGQGPVDCPRNYAKPVPDKCTGWRDNAGTCRHGFGGSGMTGGRGGYLGPCGAGHCQ